MTFDWPPACSRKDRAFTVAAALVIGLSAATITMSERGPFAVWRHLESALVAEEALAGWVKEIPAEGQRPKFAIA